MQPCMQAEFLIPASLFLRPNWVCVWSKFHMAAQILSSSISLVVSLFTVVQAAKNE